MADVKIATTRVACNTSTGTQDIAISGFGTPKAALFILSRTVTDGTAVDQSIMCFGATDTNRQWAVSTSSQHNVVTTTVRRRGMTDKCVAIINEANGVMDGEAGFSAWITDGIRIDWTDAPAGAYLLTVVLFGGADLTARVDNVNLGTVTTAQTYSAMGFEADAMFLGGVNEGMPDANSNFYIWFMGLVHNNGAGTITQRSMGQAEATSQADGAPLSRMMDDKCGFQHTINAETVDHEYTLSNFSSTGFQFTSNANANSDKFGFLALKFGGLSSKVGTYQPPTTATTSTINPGFEPQFCLLGLNGCAAVDTSESDSDAGPMGISVMDATAQYCNSVAIEDAAATTNTQSLSDNQAINLPAHDGAGFYAATLDGFDAGGVDLNFSAANGTTRQWIYLAVETAAGGGGNRRRRSIICGAR